MDHRALTALFDALERRKASNADPIALPGADLQGAMLLRADLVEADLTGARLDHANLSGARLGRARLIDASLKSIKLDGADLTETDLTNANLDGALVRGTCLAGTILRGASIRGLVGAPDSLVGASIDWKACERSGLEDRAIIQLYRDGADLVDLEAFSDEVRRACVSRRRSFPGEPSEEQMRENETLVRKARLQHDLTIPPSSRRGAEMQRLSMHAPSDGSAPTRAMRAAPLPDDLLALAAVVMPPLQEAGDKVAGATLVEVIGRGSSATVWRAETEDGTTVAVKVFDMSLYSTGLLLHAFRRGVRTMNRLIVEGGDAHLLRINAVDVNHLAFSFEYAQNGNLTSLPALSWPTKRLVELFSQLCSAVEGLHAAGVLHRCLRLSNVLLDEELRPRLTDIDIVDLPTLAAASPEVGGYAPYAAPEEILDTSTMSPTADIFSLGRILAFMLTGEEPDPIAEEVPALASLKNQPAGLIRIIRKCTLRDPAVRYQVVADLIRDLARYEEYDQVGIAGGALETNFMPYRISSLPPVGLVEVLTQRRANDARAEAKAAVVRQTDDKPTRWLSRSTELRIAIVGGAALLGAAIVLAITPLPGEGLVQAVNITSIIGAALLTLAAPPFAEQQARARLAIAFGAATLVYLLSPGALATQRLQASLTSPEPIVRGKAVRLLTARGHRDFTDADLSRTDLSRAELTVSSFRGAHMAGANLDESMLNESEFDGADLTDASALGADFYLANPERATGWETVRCDEFTRMPRWWACRDGVPVSTPPPP